MKALKVIILLFLLSATISAQYETWKNYTNINNVKKVAVTSNAIWGVTGGGLFKYDLISKTYTIYTKADGLSSQDLTALAIDGYGNIWVGSSEGFINVLFPSSGSISKIYDIYNSSKAQKGINNLTVSGDTLFVSHGFGLSLINTATLSFMDNVIKFGSLSTETAVESVTPSSQMYVCLYGGLAIHKTGITDIYSPDDWNSYSFTGASLNKAVVFNNEIYIATDGGIYKFSNGSFNFFALPSLNIIDLGVKDNYLYALTNTRLYKYSSSLQQVYAHDDTTHTLTGFAMLSDNIYISSNRGIINISSSGTTALKANAPCTNLFMNLDVDSTGNLWAGTGKNNVGQGVLFFDGSTWTNFNMANYPILPTNDYHNVYVAKDKTVYWMSWGNGYATYKNNTISVFSVNNTPLIGIPADQKFLVVADIKSDSKGVPWFLNFWPGDKNVLWKQTSDGSWYYYTFSSITAGQVFYRLIIDSYGTKWISISADTQGGNTGIFEYNESSSILNYYSSYNGLNSDAVNSIVLDTKGYLWIGTSLGVNYIPDTSSPKIYTPINTGLKNQYVYCMAVDALNQKWIGTTSGLYCLSEDCTQQISHYDVSNSPLQVNDVKSLTIDKKKGIIYIGTDNGLTVLKTIYIQPNDSFDKLTLYPSPFIINDGKNTVLRIDGLLKNCYVRILSLTGSLIYQFQNSGGKIGYWDGRDFNGNFVASGIYFVVAYDQEGNSVVKGKAAIIKK